MTKDERFRIIDAAVFRTLSAEDWRAAFRQARVARNSVAARIRERVGSKIFQGSGPAEVSKHG
jgi:hypothetical protein